jgi:hypothetical protein
MVFLSGVMPELIPINFALELIPTDLTSKKSPKKFIARFQKAEHRMHYLLKRRLKIFLPN